MRICVVNDFFVPHYHGGGEQRHYEILRRLVQRGHTVDYLCMRIKDVPNQEDIAGIKVHHIGPTIAQPPRRSMPDFLRFIVAAKLWLLRNRYDIVEGQGIGLLAVSAAGLITRARSVAVIHDLSASGKADQWISFSRLAGLAEKGLIRLPFHKVITVSAGVKERLVSEYGLDQKKIAVIHNGVDIELADSIKVQHQDSPTVVFVGRLIPHKHVDDLIEATAILVRRFPALKLKIVGTGQELDNLKRLAHDRRLDKHVVFIGSIPDYKDVLKEIKRSTIMALPSTREGFGMVLVEAYACGVPCVAYYSDGVVDIIEDSVNGFLVKQRDVAQLAGKIGELLQSPKKAAEFARAGRAKTERKFTWDKVVRSIEQQYVQLVVRR